MSNIIEARFFYSGEFQNPHGRKWYPVFLADSEFIQIDEVDLAKAPVAYRITTGHPSAPYFDVRLHAGALWWPLYDDSGPLTTGTFFALAKNDWESAAAVLDPLGRTYDGVRQTFEQYFDGRGVKDFRCDREIQALQVRSDAARLMSFGGALYVDAGEPVWFAIFNNETRGSFDLVAGPSSLDRRDRNGCRMPCADRGTRITAARLGRAYGLDELEQLLPRLDASEVRREAQIHSTGIFQAGSAAVMCATAWAHYLWEVAWRYPDLRKLISAVAQAKSNRPPPANLPYREMLQQFVEEAVNIESWRLPGSLSEAELILARLASVENSCDPTMDAAIGAL